MENTPYLSGDGLEKDKILNINYKDTHMENFKNKVKAAEDSAREDFRPFCARCALDELQKRDEERIGYIKRLSPKQEPDEDMLRINIDIDKFGELEHFSHKHNKGRIYDKLKSFYDNKTHKLIEVIVDFTCKNGHGYSLSVMPWDLNKVPFLHHDRNIDPEELEYWLKRGQIRQKKYDELAAIPSKKLEVTPTVIEEKKRGKKK